MGKLIIKNTISQLIIDNESIIDALYKALRFRDPSYFHKRKTMNLYGWDGFVDFFSKKTGKFATGLLPEILKALKALNLKIDIEDLQGDIVKHDIITEDFLPGRTLYEHQIDIANIVWEMKRGIIKCPTGSGKTSIFTAIIKSIPENIPALILFRSKTLASQAYRDFKKFGIKNAGIIHGEVWDPNIKLLATIQSAHKYEKLLDKFKILIVDEVHEFSRNASIRIFKKMINANVRLGFSATPWQKGDKIMKYKIKSWFGPIIADIPTIEMQEKNILSSAKCYFHKITKPDIQIYNYNEAYDYGVIKNQFMHKRVKQILDSYSEGRFIVVVERLEHGYELTQYIPNSYWIQGSDKEEDREMIINKLKISNPGEKIIVIATRIMQTGVDFNVHGVINCAGYKSFIMTIQRLGRGLRKAPDKTHLDYHDFYFENNVNRYLNDHSKKRMKDIKSQGHETIIVD